MPRPSARSASITSQESYSAVMITDLVADVPISTECEPDSAKTTKEATNFGYDGHMDGEANCSIQDRSANSKANGPGISRGVILNAVQFGQNNTSTKIDEKPMQMTASLPVPTLTQQTPEPKGFKDMSLQRKIAFGFSFLPSILFVLCFAVILPCNVPRPCVEEAWITSFDYTEPTSGLELSEQITLTALKQGKNVLLELNKENGKFSDKTKLSTPPAYLMCGKIMNKDRKECFVMDTHGKIFSFKDSKSKRLWDPVSDTDVLPPSPVILSSCSDNMESMAVVVSNTTVKVLYSGNKISKFEISNCGSVPVKLMPWTLKSSSNIVLLCDERGKDRLVKIPKNVWCSLPSENKENPLVLHTGDLDSIKNSVLLPIEDYGLALWSEDVVSMIHPNGTLLWNVSVLSHSQENRFALHGKFHGEDKQLAILSSNLVSGLKVTLLNPSDGSVLKTASYQDIEVTEVKNIPGKKRDFLLLLLKKMKTARDMVATAFAQISDISTTIVSLLSNEELKDDTPSPIAVELALLDLDGHLVTVKQITDEANLSYKTTMAAITDKETDKETAILRVYLLSTSSNAQMKTTEVRNINVANWDKSTKSKCLP